MIYFQTENGRLNLTNQKIRFNEENNLFINDTVKSYSSSFYRQLDDDFLQVMGLPSYDNISSVNAVVEGFLFRDNTIHEAYIRLGEAVNNQVQLQIYYGEEVLEVYSTFMSDLPWPTIITSSLLDSAKSMLDKGYPDVTHNWPKIYRPDIKNEDGYEAFIGFLNNYQNNVFIDNYTLGAKINLTQNTTAISANGENHFITTENTTSTRIVSIIGAVTGGFYIIEGGSDEKASTIESDSLFDIKSKFTASQGAYIRLLYNGSQFIEIGRGKETPFFLNQNILVPHPYLIEMIRFGYAQEGKQLRGDLMGVELFKKILYVPDQLLERFSSSDFVGVQFTTPTSESFEGTIDLGVYSTILNLDRIGVYNLEFKTNFDSTVAGYFSLEIIEENALQTTSVFRFDSESTNKRVNLSEKLEINVTPDNQFSKLKIELKLPLSQLSIVDYNSFEFSYKDGRANVFPKNYSLAEFMPDMTFGEFMNNLKNWLNLDIEIEDDNVYLNFADKTIQSIPSVDHSHMESYSKSKAYNNNRVFKLMYQDDSVVYFDKDGQRYDDPREESEVIPLEMKVSVLEVENNQDFVTSAYDNYSGLKFCLYNGLQSGQNDTVSEVDNENIGLQRVTDNYWKNWLLFRCNSKTFKDTFIAHFSETFDFRKAYFKYNERMIITKINRTRISETQYQVQQEAESI